jgi:glycosyltransferase involved in cell wall biosynthesis
MRIVIDARVIADRFPGIGRYAYNLLGALPQVAPQHEFVALVADLPNTRYDLSTLDVQLAPAAARPLSIREQWQIPLQVQRLKADLLHATYYVRPYLGLACPVVTTFYDSIPLRFPAAATLPARIVFTLLHRTAAASSSNIITISRHAQRDLAATFAITESKLCVTPLAADPQFVPQPATQIAIARKQYDLADSYVLTLASNKAHKNLAGLLRAWRVCCERMPMPQLVIAGHYDPHGTDLAALTQEFAESAVRWLKNVPNEALPALYSGAELFVYPSLYEGFGLPVLEALACGAAVVGGAHSSMPEVAGEAAILTDVEHPVVFAEAIMRLLRDSALRLRLKQAAVRQAARFSWAETARATVAVYEDAV